ncbi:MAG: DUF4249 family protein [Rhodothermales bacterium]
MQPIIGEERPFTIWGFLDAGADTQQVRVVTIEEVPGADRPGEIDATVTSTDLTTGEKREWTHERVTFEDSTTGHVFRSVFRALHEHRYRLEVSSSDGSVSSAEVTVPPEVDIVVEQGPFSPIAHVYVYGGAPNLINVEMRYEVTNLPPLESWPAGRPIHPPVFFPVEIPYGDRGEEIADRWHYKIDMKEDFFWVRDALHGACLLTGGAPDIALRRVEFHLVAADSAWRPPGGVFDADLLVEPGTMSNVENGYGFFGAGEVFKERWTPSKAVRDAIGFKEDRPCPTSAPIQACMEPPVPCLSDAPGGMDAYFSNGTAPVGDR